MLAQDWVPYLKPTSAHHRKVTFINPKGSVLSLSGTLSGHSQVFSSPRRGRKKRILARGQPWQDPLSTASITPHPPSQSESESHSVVSDSLEPHGLYNPWNSPGQNTGVGSPSLLQGIFPIQGSNSGLPNCRWILYQVSHKGSPRIMEWVALPSYRGSSQPRNWTRVSCIAGRFFYQLSCQRSPGHSQNDS